MRRLMLSWTVVLTFFVVHGNLSHAQSIPSGSYQQSCRNIDVHEDVLTANCQDSTGRMEATQLRDYRSCGNDISNDNGALRCGNGPGAGQAGYAGIPPGSYTQTCQEVKVHGDDLEARCQTTSGDWHKSKISDYQRCRGDFVNDNGNLRCVDAGYPPANQGGYNTYPAAPIGTSYTQTCKDIKSHGDDLRARCKNSHGDFQETSLDDYRKCHGQIVNEDGNLRCVAAPVAGYPAGTPAGSYAQTCKEIHLDGDELVARCSTTGGDWRDAKLDDYSSCKSEIINDDGHLRCSK